MKIAAVICEFDPFHFGHKYLIDNIKKNVATHVVGIMSSNFTQRGEPSIISKRARTEIAIGEGIDLIIEIPSVWSMSTAEKYAFAGTFIANSLGCIDSLCFASEIGDIDILKTIAKAIDSEQFSAIIKKHLALGITFAKARELTVKEILGEDYSNVLQHPNNILAVEYLKSLIRLGSNMSPYTIKRIGSQHGEQKPYEKFASASYIRNLIKNQKGEFSEYIPELSSQIISREIREFRAPADVKLAERAILSSLRSMTRENISNLCDVSEGIEGRLFKFSKCSSSFDQLIQNIKTKRYTVARIKRLIMYAFLGITRFYHSFMPKYARVLGFSEMGLEILKKTKKTSSIPIMTDFSHIKKLDDISVKLFEKECLCTDLYNIMLPKVGICGQEQQYRLIKSFLEVKM